MIWQAQTEAHAMMGAANAVNTGWNDPRAWMMDVPGEGSSPIMTDATDNVSDNVLHNDLINDCFMTEQDDHRSARSSARSTTLLPVPTTSVSVPSLTAHHGQHFTTLWSSSQEEAAIKFGDPGEQQRAALVVGQRHIIFQNSVQVGDNRTHRQT